jgi:hypothetical protein
MFRSKNDGQKRYRYRNGPAQRKKLPFAELPTPSHNKIHDTPEKCVLFSLVDGQNNFQRCLKFNLNFELSPSPSPPSSLTNVHSIQSHTLPTPTLLTFMCTQVLWCLPCLTRSRPSGVTMTPNTSRTIFSTRDLVVTSGLTSD